MQRSSVLYALVAALLAVAMGHYASTHAYEKVGNYLVPVMGGIVKVKKASIPKKCDVVIVGGGAGGMYSAYRLLSGAKDKYKSVCAFEYQERLGGRISSLRGLGRRGDMTVDIGAYRYVDGQHTLVQGVVENLLKLKYMLYDPATTTYRKIVDDEGTSIGFVTFVEGLAQKAIDLGLKLFYNKEVVKVDKITGSKDYVVVLANGKKIITQNVIFNVPQRPLYRILQNSNLARSTEWNEALFTPYPLVANKMYVYYEDAWWLYMNRTTGSFNDPNNGGNDTNLWSLPLRGRYHDGPSKCNADKTKCWGFLMMTYSNDGGGTWSNWGQGLDTQVYGGVTSRYYAPYAVNPDLNKPFVVLDDTTQMGNNILGDAHKKLMDWHSSRNITIPSPYTSILPTQAVVAVWDPQTPWSGGAWHSMRNGTFGDEPQNVPAQTIQPFAGEQIYVANEAFSTQLGWAEGSLVMAENLLIQKMGVAKPTFITSERHACVIYATYNYNSTLCNLSLNPIVQGTSKRRSAQETKKASSAWF